MHVSSNELRSTAEKAAVGARVEPANARVLARAVSWLVAHDFDGVGALIGCCTHSEQTLVIASDGPSHTITSCCAARHGVNIVDLLTADMASEGIQIASVDAPWLLVGLLGVASHQGHVFDLHSPGTGDWRIAVGSFGPAAPSLLPDHLEDLRVTVRSSSPSRQTPSGALRVDDQQWHRLLSLAAHAYVPSSERSRQAGAGAGMIDND